MTVYRLYPVDGPDRVVDTWVGSWDPVHPWLRAAGFPLDTTTHPRDAILVYRSPATPRGGRPGWFASAYVVAGRPLVLKRGVPVWVHPACFTAKTVPPERRRP